MKEQDPQDCYFGYTRVSSQEQSESESLTEQSRQINNFAKNHNMIILNEYTETHSAKENNRPTFNRMILEARKLKIKGFIFPKIDRAARSLRDQVTLEDLSKEGFELHFVADGISSNGVNKGLMFLQFGMAKFYIENLRQEVDKGITGMLNDGRSPMPPPIGYRAKGKGNKDADPETKNLVKKAFEMYATGVYTVIDIAKEMELLGLVNKKGHKIYYKDYYKMFRNPFYYGIIRYRKIDYQGKHEPLVNRELFDKVQLVLDRKGFKHQRVFVYTFQSLLKCPKCRSSLRSLSAKRKYKYYNCHNQKCDFNSIKEEAVEAAFLPELEKLEFNDEDVRLFVQAVQRFRVDLVGQFDTQIAHINLEMNKVDMRLEDLMNEYLAKKLDNIEYGYMRSKLIDRQRELIERKEDLNKSDDKVFTKMEEIGKLLKKPSLAYKIASEFNRRHLVKSLCENLIWTEGKLIPDWKKDLVPVQKMRENTFGSATENRTPI